MERRLKTELVYVEDTLRRATYWRELAVCWFAAAGLAVLVLLVQAFTGWVSQIQWILPLLGGVIGAVVVWRRHALRDPDYRAVVEAIEREHPGLRHLLSAAAEQEPDADSGEFRYLQLRVIDEALTHPARPLWQQGVEQKLYSARAVHGLAMVVFLGAVLVLGYSSARSRPVFHSSLLAREITVTPGDTQVERGTSLVISARFGGEPPAEATLVLVSDSGKTKNIPLERHLADPVFGASLVEVTEAGLYHIEYGREKTRDFKITVFDYPALLRADATLHYPEYTALTNRTIPDTLRITAVEGTRLTYTLQLNKPVAKARFLSHEGSLTLEVQSNSVALLRELPLTNSVHYSLALTDADGRTNKFPTEFVLQVLPNKRPELKLISPNGDQRVSSLEELQLQAEATDDFGLLKYGVGYAAAGQDPQLIELGQSVPGRQKRQFNYLILMEKLGVEPDQLISYFVWADDYGPDGKPRRTLSDVFFAEIRPFEEVFRPDQSGGGGGGGQGQQSGNGGVELAEMQKEIAIATWKLQQEKLPSVKPRLP